MKSSEGPLDLAGLGVGPPVALGNLDSLTDGSDARCKGQKPLVRVLLEVPVVVKVDNADGKSVVDATVTALLLVAASPDRLCVEGIDMSLPKGETALSARLDKGTAGN